MTQLVGDMTASSDPDWWARAISGLALLVSVLGFVWTRLDKRRDRSADEAAVLPIVHARMSFEADDDGWHTIKFTFHDVTRGVRFERAKLLEPSGGELATWNGLVWGPSGTVINPRWEFDETPNSKLGDRAAAVTYLHFRAANDLNLGHYDVEIRLFGRFRHARRKPFTIEVIAYRG